MYTKQHNKFTIFLFLVKTMFLAILILIRKSPYSVRIQENTDQKNSIFGLFSRSVCKYCFTFRLSSVDESLIKMYSNSVFCGYPGQVFTYTLFNHQTTFKKGYQCVFFKLSRIPLFFIKKSSQK